LRERYERSNLIEQAINSRQLALTTNNNSKQQTTNPVLQLEAVNLKNQCFSLKLQKCN
jgi:hypothetical protein